VATTVGGTGEIFPVGSTTAKLVAAGNPGQLAAAILHLLSDAELRRRLGNAARQRAEQAFDARHSALALASHYRHVMRASGLL
jgi:glycosyltransferase involved in cell wall biosynthesis